MELHPTQVVEVKIYNQTYYIRGEGDSEYIQQLAAYVDRRMKEVAAGTMTADSLRVAILAALNIADELYKIRRKLEQLDYTIGERSSEYAQLLDNLLKKAK
ncbi:MAG: cell division protein ZapA [Blastocatellia bacterium]|jgi:cell division protein ZapA|nr:cell division protein ZapA [Blastocatellia bacterium]MBN8724306.1 cell division protein ZapA [Acidobacteriota bacterium]